MFDFNDLYFLIFVYGGSVIVLYITLLFLISLVVEFYRKKNIKIKAYKIITLTLLLFLIYLSFPWWCLFISLRVDDYNIAESYNKLAIKTSVFRSVKSHMYSNLSSIYFSENNGQLAIESSKKALSLSKCDLNNYEKSYSDIFHLCYLYTVKGDKQNAIKYCKIRGDYDNLIAINYILNDDYKQALAILNKRILNKNKKINGMLYLTRANVYENLGETDNAQSDYKMAEKLLSSEQLKLIEQAKSNKNYYKDFYKQEKIKYGFN